MNNQKLDKLIRIKEAAEMFGIHPETLRRWSKKGKINAVVINDRGDRRFKLSEISKFINQKT